MNPDYQDNWLLNPQPFKGSHYAVFPMEVPLRAIRAGTSDKGCCEACGAPHERVVERIREHGSSDVGTPKYGALDASNGHNRLTRRVKAARSAGEEHDNPLGRVRTTGWQPTCSCNGEFEREPYEVEVVNRETDETETHVRYRSKYVPSIPLEDHPLKPATVLDPFLGSGTTALAARRLGRRSTGFDLDERNIALVEERMGPQGVML